MVRGACCHYPGHLGLFLTNALLSFLLRYRRCLRVPRKAPSIVCRQVFSGGLLSLIRRRTCAPFLQCSYTNYARLVMFSFGFQKAFERGFEADDEVFFTRVRVLVHLTIFGQS